MATLPPDTAPFDSPTLHRRAWLASLLLQQHKTWLGRFALRLSQLASLPREQRLRLQRKAAVSLAGAALVLSLSAGLLAQPTTLHAAIITVDNGAVNFAQDGDCSLKEAIFNANYDTTFSTSPGECAVGTAGLDTIELPLNGSFSLTATGDNFYGPTGLTRVSSEIVISGNGSTIQRTTGSFRIIAVTQEGVLTLNDTTISGGSGVNDGAGILNWGGKLTLNHSTVSGSVALTTGGGIHSFEGTLTLNQSRITYNQAGKGGGLYTVGTLTVDQSLIDDNIANAGGGTFSSGIATITNSTISGNLAAPSAGGGVYNGASTMTITNSTITGNFAGSIGGGIYSVKDGGFTMLVNCIISGNTAQSGGHEFYTYGANIFGHDNVFGHAQLTNKQAFVFPVNSMINLTATSDGTIPTALGDILDTTLADNGGPTLTHTLVANSPAIDHNPTDVCAAPPVDGVDQRGAFRNIDIPFTGNDFGINVCDIGSIEWGSVIPTATPEATASPTSTAQPTASATPVSTTVPGDERSYMPFVIRE